MVGIPERQDENGLSLSDTGDGSRQKDRTDVGYECVNLIHTTQDCSYEHCNEPSCSVKGGKFLD